MTVSTKNHMYECESCMDSFPGVLHLVIKSANGAESVFASKEETEHIILRMDDGTEKAYTGFTHMGLFAPRDDCVIDIGLQKEA